MSGPLVSVIVPVFNDIKYVGRCFESILDQDYDNIEMVIVDGVSTDGTLELVRDYKNRYPEKINFISEPDQGGGDAWNKGLKMAKGDIFGILGADDICPEGTIKTAVDFFQSTPEAKFIYGGCEFLDENGDVVRRSVAEKFDFKVFVNTARHISTTSAFYKREVVEKIGWLDDTWDDFEVLIKMTKDFDAYHIDKIFSQVTIRPGSIYNSPTDFKKFKEIRKQTFDASRRYGGSLFSSHAIRYYAIFIVDLFHLNSLYPFLRDVYKRCFVTLPPAVSGKK